MYCKNGCNLCCYQRCVCKIISKKSLQLPADVQVLEFCAGGAAVVRVPAAAAAEVPRDVHEHVRVPHPHLLNQQGPRRR